MAGAGKREEFEVIGPSFMMLLNLANYHTLCLFLLLLNELIWEGFRITPATCEMLEKTLLLSLLVWVVGGWRGNSAEPPDLRYNLCVRTQWRQQGLPQLWTSYDFSLFLG